MASDLLMKICFIIFIMISLTSTNDSAFAVFNCQKKVTVCKNVNATLTCNSTKKIDGIILSFFQEDKTKSQLLFNVTKNGNYFRDEMQFELEENLATLVIRNIQVSRGGVYHWTIMGKGSSNEFTELDVLESPTVSKENGILICRATLENQRKITWSNDLPKNQTELTTNADATGLFNFSISQPWNDSFNNNPPCCKIVYEEGSQGLCAKTCYHTSVFMKPIPGTPETLQRKNVLWSQAIPILIASLIFCFICYTGIKTCRRRNTVFFRNDINDPILEEGMY